MASGRVGGTKSKISGQVGSTIYQIRKNDDGSYSQIVTAKGVQTINRTTPRLQAQRMCTAMVESVMRDLAPVAKISMQSAANKSKSLNAFSSFNLRLVAQDCKANWYGNNKFPYPYYTPNGNNQDDIGGPFMLSAGTLQFNLFDEINHSDLYDWNYGKWDFDHYEFYYMKWNLISSYQNVGDFFKAHKITRIDTIVFCGWMIIDVPVEGEEGVVESFSKHLYLIMRPNPAVSDGAPLTEDIIKSMFIIQANYDFNIYLLKDGSGFGIGWKIENWEYPGYIYYYGGFSISYLEGKKKISSSVYKDTFGEGTPWIANSWPAYRFGSWMGQYSDHNWPSPFV